MNIRILVSMSGKDFSYSAGDIVTVDDEQAKQLIKAGHAIKDNKHKRESATLAKAETAVAPTKKKKKKRASK